MTRALASVILVLINEFIKNDNKKITNVKFFLSHKTEKKSHYYYSQVYSQFDTGNQNA